MGRTHRMADEDYSVEAAGDVGAAATKPMEAGQVRKGGFIMIKGKPCKVLDVSTSKTGKHGHAKCHFVASNIFTGKKQEELCPATHNIDVPFVFREDYQVMDIGEEDDGGYLSLMAPDGESREDLCLPHLQEGCGTDDDVKNTANIKTYFEAGDCDVFVTVLKACGTEKIVDVKKTMACEVRNESIRYELSSLAH